MIAGIAKWSLGAVPWVVKCSQRNLMCSTPRLARCFAVSGKNNKSKPPTSQTTQDAAHQKPAADEQSLKDRQARIVENKKQESKQASGDPKPLKLNSDGTLPIFNYREWSGDNVVPENEVKESFRMMSYNILADSLIPYEMYKPEQTKNFDPKIRIPQLFRDEIDFVKPDVLLFQENQKGEETSIRLLEERGYQVGLLFN